MWLICLKEKRKEFVLKLETQVYCIFPLDSYLDVHEIYILVTKFCLVVNFEFRVEITKIEII